MKKHKKKQASKMKHSSKIEQRKCGFTGASENCAKYVVHEWVIGVSDISFRLLSHDWEKFEKSELWNQVCQFLSEVQKGYSPMYPQVPQDLPEYSYYSS